MLVLPNVTIKSSNVRKNKETTKCDKNTVACNVDTAQCEDNTIMLGHMWNLLKTYVM